MTTHSTFTSRCVCVCFFIYIYIYIYIYIVNLSLALPVLAYTKSFHKAILVGPLYPEGNTVISNIKKHPTAQHHIPQDFNPKSLQASCHVITLTSVVLPEEMYSITLHTVPMGHTSLSFLSNVAVNSSALTLFTQQILASKSTSRSSTL